VKRRADTGTPVASPPALSSRLRARPADAVTDCGLPAGCTALGLAEGRDGLLHVPVAATTRPSPLVVLLHGAGSSASAALMLLAELTEAHGLILLVPDSRSSSWDFLRGGFGPDVQFIDRALEHVFEHCPIDPERIALVGFSDGASYALSLGIANGDLFTHLIAFSPGFARPETEVGQPRVFVTHGTRDDVLPIDLCSRRLVPVLRAGGLDLAYTEFDGGHSVPRALVQRAVTWMTEG
jgi:phospholipase/carboxylesterase